MAEEEDYDAMVERVSAANGKVFGGFLNVMVGERKKGKRKMNDIVEKMRFFAEDYLMNYESETFLEGLESFGSFVGDWFIRKCMWSDPKSVGENVEAFRVFVGFLKEQEIIPEERGGELVDRIEGDVECWKLRAKYYNDPEVDMEDLFEDGWWNDDLIAEWEEGERRAQ